MPRTNKSDKKPIEQYDHKGKERVNNPPVGLVTPETDKDSGKKIYAYDPHLDPQLQWAGKAERTSFDVPTTSLHVHERIDPRTIIEAVRKCNGKQPEQLSLFNSPEENPPLREAIQFYKHKHNWSNRLIAGDSLLVMNSLLEKEGMAGKVQMVYLDPPYGIKYGSNFQPFVNKRDVKDGKDEDLTAEPEQIRAFRDTWELGIHSYLAYLRDRLLLARELLTESGSVFVQISDENVHLVRNILDEVFGVNNFISLIPFRKKTMPLGAKYLDSMNDYLIFYAKEKEKLKYRTLFSDYYPEGKSRWKYDTEKKEWYRLVSMRAPGYTPENDYEVKYNGKTYRLSKNQSWIVSKEKFKILLESGRIELEGDTLSYKLLNNDFPYQKITNFWTDTSGPTKREYVVETSTFVIQRCILMTTDPGDLVFDPTCGSGTTAYVAEQWGRRWITCDTSRVALTLAKQRIMTAIYDYYELAHPQEGVGSGFRYKTVPHITLKSIANNEPPGQETLYDQPYLDNKKARVSGPFTVEAVPAPTVKPLSEIEETPASDESVSRCGETLRQAEWRDELQRCGIRGKNGQHILFSRVEPLSGTRWLHAEAETKEDTPQRVIISFGPEHAPLEQRQVELAWEEAHKLMPRPAMIIFAAFQFDPEAAKDIDEIESQKTGMTFLKVQMNADLLTDDLKKKRTSNESFWLIGQPDVRLEKIKEGKDVHNIPLTPFIKGEFRDKDKYRVEVLGFDYYNIKAGIVESGGTENIAMWMLDTDYDGRSLLPRQVFFPMAGEKDGWSRLAKNLKAEIDEELIEAYRGTVSLPFEMGENRRIAVKIVDDRGIESLKIIEI
ncbi:MAG: site-specific DNA-methyltransferase [Nitrospirota bacterium]